MLKAETKPQADIPKDKMVEAKVAFLKNRNKLLQNQINQNEEAIMRLENLLK